MLIVTAGNEPYMHRIKALVMSALVNTPYRICVFSDIEENPFAGFPRVTYELLKNDGKYPDHDFWANVRPLLFNVLFEMGRPMVWFDADTIVRGPLTELDFHLRNTFPTAAVDTSSEFRTEDNQILISTVGLAGTTLGKRFLDAWMEEMWAIREAPSYEPSIMTVQTAYVRATRRGFPWWDFGYKYSDKHFRPESPVWEAQGNRKYEDEDYLEEERRYLASFNLMPGR